MFLVQGFMLQVKTRNKEPGINNYKPTSSIYAKIPPFKL